MLSALFNFAPSAAVPIDTEKAFGKQTEGQFNECDHMSAWGYRLLCLGEPL